SVYRPEWGVTNGSLLDTPEACQDLVDHVVPPGYFSELLHMHNEDFLGQYNINLARKVAMGSQLRLRFEQEAKLLRKSVAQVDDLQEQVSGEETLMAAFEDYKRQQDQMVEQRCRRWVIGRGLRLATMKCAESLEMRQAFADVVSARIAKGMSEGLKHGVEHGMIPGRMLHNLYATSAPALLSSASRYIQSRAEQKKRSRIVCRTHGVGSAHHARSDRVSVSAPIVVPQGLALFSVDAATQAESDA
nr:hypothetical protein [Tanacetum cinerariifolium]